MRSGALRVGRTARLLAILLLSSLMAARAGAEMFKVRQTWMLSIPADGTPQSVTAQADDAIVISLPEDKGFIEGVEILFKVPPEVAQWIDSVSWAFYNGVKPEPTENRTDYRGKRTTVGTFGDLLSLDIKVPLAKPNSIKQDAYSVYIDDIPDFKNGKIFLRLQPAVRDSSGIIGNSRFDITVKPIYINRGRLNITLLPPEGEALKDTELFIDGQESKLTPGGIPVTPGIHDISIVSGSYRNEVRTVTVTQAKTVELEIQLRDITPTVRLAIPIGTQAYCDGSRVEDTKKPMKLEQGKHSFRFVLGGYEISKQVDIINGHTYTVALNIDASVSEDD